MAPTSRPADELLLADQGGTTSYRIDTAAFHFDGTSISFAHPEHALDLFTLDPGQFSRAHTGHFSRAPKPLVDKPNKQPYIGLRLRK